MTIGTYPWSLMTQILHNGQLWHSGNHKSDDFNFTKRNLWFRGFLASSNPLSRKSW